MFKKWLFMLIAGLCFFVMVGIASAKPYLTCDPVDPVVTHFIITGLSEQPIKVPVSNQDANDPNSPKILLYDLANLEPGNYTVTVKPVNDWEEGVASDPLSFTRPKRLSDIPVQNVRIVVSP